MIEHEGPGLIGASQLYVPEAERARATNSGSVAAWEALLARSRERPDEFWADVARELEWMRPWDVVREGHFPHFKYFVGGVGNPTVNLLDRHLTRGAARPRSGDGRSRPAFRAAEGTLSTGFPWQGPPAARGDDQGTSTAAPSTSPRRSLASDSFACASGKVL